MDAQTSEGILHIPMQHLQLNLLELLARRSTGQQVARGASARATWRLGARYRASNALKGRGLAAFVRSNEVLSRSAVPLTRKSRFRLQESPHEQLAVLWNCQQQARGPKSIKQSSLCL